MVDHPGTIAAVRTHHHVKGQGMEQLRRAAELEAAAVEKARIQEMRATSDAIRTGTDERMLPLGEMSDQLGESCASRLAGCHHAAACPTTTTLLLLLLMMLLMMLLRSGHAVPPADAALATKMVPAISSLNTPRVQDAFVVSVFGETQQIIHGLVDAFASLGAVSRVDQADPHLKLNISVPVRGEFGLLDVRFACIGPPSLQNLCVAMELPARLTSAGARIDLREALKASLVWMQKHRGVETSWSADMATPEPDDGLIMAYAPVGTSPTEARPMLSAGAALVADATAAQLAPFRRGSAAARQEPVSAAVLDVLTKEQEASVLPALATRVVDGTGPVTIQPSASPSAKALLAAPVSSPVSPATSAGVSPASLVAVSSSVLSTNSEDAPGEDDLAHALPRDLRTPAASSAAQPAVVAPAARPAPSALQAPASAGFFAESSPHIRACLSRAGSGTDTDTHAESGSGVSASAVQASKAVRSLQPLASAVEAGGAASTSALATASRLILAQPIGSTRTSVRTALDEAGVPRAAWELLARLGAHHAAEEAKAGGHAATRAPAVAGRVMQEAAGQLGLSPSGLCIALQGALILGAHSVGEGDLSPSSPSSSATVDAVRLAANKWAVLPESDDVAMVQIQRSATELADALDNEDALLGHATAHHHHHA
jgi:hypothetical protein